MAYSRKLLSGPGAPAVAFAGMCIFLGWLWRFEGFYSDKFVGCFAAGVLLWLFWSRTRRSNLLIARFVSSLEHADLAQAFRTSGRGSGLDELGAAFDVALRRLRTERHASAAENRFAAALVDEAPTPLLAINRNGAVHLANKAARRLFRESEGKAAEAFLRYGGGFARALETAEVGDRLLCRIRWNGLLQRAVLAVAGADRQGVPWRIVSIQIIQSELDAAEMATQTDLVRVLTHEIMNSLTPVTSLAATAAKALSSFDGTDPEALEDTRLAISALSERAIAVSEFVEAYRNFSKFPSVKVASFEAARWLRDLVRVFQATPQAKGVALDVQLARATLRIQGDANLLGQVLLNLLKNGGQATRGEVSAAMCLRVATNEADRIVISVSDNGPGVPGHLAEEIFLPFFTTKVDGTGIGLSFAKQVVLLHNGTIGLADPELGGATFQIVL